MVSHQAAFYPILGTWLQAPCSFVTSFSGNPLADLIGAVTVTHAKHRMAA